MSTTRTDLTTARYREVRRRALATIAERIVRDPPSDRERDFDVTPYVRQWVDEEYGDALGGFDPAAVEAAVPREPEDVDTAAGTPTAEADSDERRRSLYARHAVRSDLVAELSGDVEYLRRAAAVHDALERIVGQRGERTDRRPSGVVEAFGEWVAERRDAASAERARAAFTPLHVMRIAGLSVTSVDPADRDLLHALEDWLGEEHASAFERPDDGPPGGFDPVPEN